MSRQRLVVSFAIVAVVGAIALAVVSGVLGSRVEASTESSFTGGPLTFALNEFCDTFTLAFLDIGNGTSRVTGVTDVPCASIQGNVMGTMTRGGSMHLLVTYDVGPFQTISCALNAAGQGPCNHSRGVSSTIGLRAAQAPGGGSIPSMVFGE